MSKRHEFIKKYFSAFLEVSRIRNPFVEFEQSVKIPPTHQELEELVSILQRADLDPIIVGTLAVIKYLSVTPEDLQARVYRPIQTIDFVIAKDLPAPPLGWKCDQETRSWISSEGGHVNFFLIGDLFSEERNMGKDLESVEMDCPIADVESLFLMKLSTRRERDIGDLMMLAKKVGIPQDIHEKLWNSTQQKNLEFLKHWVRLVSIDNFQRDKIQIIC